MTIKSTLKYLAALILAVLLTSGTAFASLTSESHAALSQLKSQNSAAAKVSSRAMAVLVDKGMARSFTTDTMHSGIYAFTFDQRGLMAGLGVQGSKITRID